MTLRMKTKESITVKYVYDHLSGMDVEAPVHIIRDNKLEEYIVSDSPQTVLGMRNDNRYERVYTGPYSHWSIPFNEWEVNRAKQRKEINRG